jgi:YbbR domain-containing protein
MIKFLRHVFLDDFVLKLFSLALAFLFWITVSFAIQQKEALPIPALPLTPEVRTIFNLPIVVVSSTSDVHSIKVTPNQAEVVVQCDPQTIQNLQSKDLRALVDLTGLDVARSPRRKIEVSVPAGVSLIGVIPPEAQVVLPPKPPAR